jgi:hypothetical protein
LWQAFGENTKCELLWEGAAEIISCKGSTEGARFMASTAPWLSEAMGFFLAPEEHFKVRVQG